MAEENKTEATEKKSGLNFKIILAGLIVFLIAMGASYFMMQSALKPLLPDEDTEQEKLATGDLVLIDQFTTNINDIAGSRYLKIEIYVEITDEKAKESIEERMPIIKDGILTILSSKNVADFDASNWGSLRQEIKEVVNSKVGINAVSNVYFTDFIMQ
ncbi:hypothetical protein SYNTR_0581 [Candidatus Syntrophocurvum alkaliphilum]|uniref:Flagellar protein FliL n=1 Tax=Candidatus Syntrophocurvum alkaliphilum TaxID=2293317 RepID=A0A6I6DCT5_9FIRM|nr:flagellar basal body-associated FliL family protein [Candidatus Syntrophocurvum alkaliphilum]QGT99174.1 hypothetical protein SYNTR_0581 [Candidatus Syntrophocurvum alkaliphilum]